MLRYSTLLKRRTVTRPGCGGFGIDPERSVLDPLFQKTPLFVVRRRFASGRHDAGPHVSQHAPPQIAVGGSRKASTGLVQNDPPFFQPVAMAGVTMVFEDRPDLLVELFRDPVRRAAKKQVEA